MEFLEREKLMTGLCILGAVALVGVQPLRDALQPLLGIGVGAGRLGLADERGNDIVLGVAEALVR